MYLRLDPSYFLLRVLQQPLRPVSLVPLHPDLVFCPGRPEPVVAASHVHVTWRKEESNYQKGMGKLKLLGKLVFEIKVNCLCCNKRN